MQKAKFYLASFRIISLTNISVLHFEVWRHQGHVQAGFARPAFFSASGKSDASSSLETWCRHPTTKLLRSSILTIKRPRKFLDSLPIKLVWDTGCVSQRNLNSSRARIKAVIWSMWCVATAIFDWCSPLDVKWQWCFLTFYTLFQLL